MNAPQRMGLLFISMPTGQISFRHPYRNMCARGWSNFSAEQVERGRVELKGALGGDGMVDFLAHGDELLRASA